MGAHLTHYSVSHPLCEYRFFGPDTLATNGARTVGTVKSLIRREIQRTLETAPRATHCGPRKKTTGAILIDDVGAPKRTLAV